MRIWDAYQRCWRKTFIGQQWHVREPIDHSYPFHEWVEHLRFGTILPWMLLKWPDDILQVATTELQADFANQVRTIGLGDMTPNPHDYILKEAEFPVRYKGKLKNYAVAFAKYRKSKAPKNSFEIYVDALSIISPLDIIFLQDEIDQTNWIPHFCKFVRTRLVEETHLMTLPMKVGYVERNTSCAEFPWLFCLTHMLNERLIQPTDPQNVPDHRGDATLHSRSD